VSSAAPLFEPFELQYWIARPGRSVAINTARYCRFDPKRDFPNLRPPSSSLATSKFGGPKESKGTLDKASAPSTAQCKEETRFKTQQQFDVQMNIKRGFEELISSVQKTTHLQGLTTSGSTTAENVRRPLGSLIDERLRKFTEGKDSHRSSSLLNSALTRFNRLN
jgi:hypothetical protein